MGFIKWAGRGLKIGGEILSADVVEEWLQDRGKALLEEKSKSLLFAWFLRNTRARRAAYADASAVISKSETFAASLASRLKTLPGVVARIANHIKDNGPSVLVKEFPLDWLAVVPRYIAKSVYTAETTQALENSSELCKFEGLPTLFLRDVCEKSETAFFHFVQTSPVNCGANNLICGVDADYGWQLNGVNGHYYCARSWRTRDFTRSREQREFLEQAVPHLESMKSTLGVLSADQLNQVKRELIGE
jgi:hypothetical protein